MDDKFEMWYPPAGFDRGLLNVKDVKVTIEKMEIEVDPSIPEDEAKRIKNMDFSKAKIHGQKPIKTK